MESAGNDLPLLLTLIEPSPAQPILLEPILVQTSDSAHQLISHALTTTLQPIGVQFEFEIERQQRPQVLSQDQDLDQTTLQSPDTDLSTLEYCLWVRCHSSKSLDCQLLSEPLAKALRSIDLPGFQTAIVQYSYLSTRSTTVVGNLVADWRLRIDLTPPIVRLRNWARWGDVQAITQLLNFALLPVNIQVSAALKNLTLQIFCTFKHPPSAETPPKSPAKTPPKKVVLDTIAPLLIGLSPQGIQGATIHGVQFQPDITRQIDTPPVWMHWLDLPALGDPVFSPTPIILAGRGDEDALSFILERLLNPDLEQCLDLGGIEIFLLRRDHLLHVMSEAPICPIQSQVATTVIKVIKQLKLPDIRGVRVHGRISGQSISIWTYGIDFDRSPLALPPVTIKHPVITKPPVAEISFEQKISEYLLSTGIWKPQIPMEKTNQLAYQPSFRWQPSVLPILIGVSLAIVSDVGIRLVLATSNVQLDTPATTSQLSFNNPMLEQQLAQYQLRCLQHGVPDILIVGSSRALRGIDPAVLQQSLADQGYSSPQVYNFGINGATAQVVDLILRQLLTPQQLPKLVIWADGSRAFNSGRADRTYETIATSDRYRQLALMSGMSNNDSPLFQAQSSFQNGYQTIDTAVDQQLDQVSLAYHHRDLVKTWLQARVPAIGQFSNQQATSTNIDSLTSISDRDIDANGFLPLELKFDPSTYYQKYTRVTGDSDSDYTNFQLRGNQDRALHQTIDFLATRNIPLIFVDMPLSDIYLDDFRRQQEVLFKQYMQSFVNAKQLTLIELDGLLNNQYDRFSDPSHLNQFGASDVSRYLVKTGKIHW
jgi:hypothetical protein